MIDRRGGVVGRYDKIHPTEDELQRGTCPGETDPPVFETDFGRIGIQICFDVNWREVDFNAPKMRQVEKKYGAKVQVTWLRDDDWITLVSLDPELAVHEVMKEFDLTPLTGYITRAQKAQDERRPKK